MDSPDDAGCYQLDAFVKALTRMGAGPLIKASEYHAKLKPSPGCLTQTDSDTQATSD